MTELSFDDGRPFDLICIGRANVDLYVAQPGIRLDEADTFKKYVGGSPANIAVGISRLGAKTAFLTRLSDDPFGRFVKTYLSEQGLDTTHVRFDGKGSRTSLAIAEVVEDQSQVLFYRNGASDLNLDISDIEASFISSAKAVLITGSSFSSAPARQAMLAVLAIAEKNDTRVFFDLDYRPAEWQDPQETSLYYTLGAGKSRCRSRHGRRIQHIIQVFQS